MDAWAVGYDDIEGEAETLILHWDGTRWLTADSPNPGSGSNDLSGVSAVSPTDVWAVGSSRELATPVHKTLILHWNGKRWSPVASPNPGTAYNALTEVSSVSPSDAWAVGSYRDQEVGNGHAFVLHWDGASWSLVKSLGSPSGLESVSAASPNDAWAVGEYTKAGHHALILHWDGTKWSRPNEVTGSPCGAGWRYPNTRCPTC
jgi:hypothetical protein